MNDISNDDCYKCPIYVHWIVGGIEVKYVIFFTNDRGLKELMDKVFNPSEGRKQNK